jgi:CheY-like chemotaxis protein
MAPKILVVDDSSDLRGMLKIFLELEGFFVVLAKDGFEALRYVAQESRPCLILLDMLMEKMNGEVFIERLKEDYPDVFDKVPIVAMSGSHDEPKFGVDGFLPKPFDLDTLTKTVHQHCHGLHK